MTPGAPVSLAQQMASDGSLPDMPLAPPPMRAVVAAASTTNPDAEAKTQQLAAQAGMGADLTRANPQAAQQRATALDLERRQIEFTNPILASQLADPNFAGIAHDDLDSLSAIDSHAATMRALTPAEGFAAFTLRPLQRRLMEFPLIRMAEDAAGGVAGLVGNVGSFFGWHGSGPTKQNLPQRIESALSPANADLNINGRPDTGNALDTVVGAVAPMLPAMIASGGTAAIADAAGLSEGAAKVLAALGIGGLFSAEQGGSIYTQLAAQGRTDAREKALLAAGINLVPNVAMGLTDFVPALARNPLAASLGVGGATGAAGRLSQNLVAGRPWWEGVPQGALQGAAVQGGMHLGFSALDAAAEDRQQNQIASLADQLRNGDGGPFRQTLASITAATEASKLRARSPEAFQAFADTQFEGAPSLRVPAEDFVNYFQGKKLDPAVAANQLGVKNLDEAAAAGSDLEIPAAKFFGQLEPEHQKALLPDVVDPSTEMTGRQTEAARQELEQWVTGGGAEKLAAEYAQADAETQATPEWKTVYGDLKQRYVDAGETDTAAEGYATLQANAIANLAKGAGLKPDELLALHNPKITEGPAPAGTVLYQGAPEDEEPEGATPPRLTRRQLNLESAKIQGEMLKGSGAPEPEAPPAPEEGQQRGWFRILGPGQYEIGKTKIGDLSTFIHEPAHAYLEMFRDLSQREGASPGLKQDFQRIAEWLGTTPEEAHEKDFTREQHEQWARANEQYVRDGQAPTSGLRRAFHHFAVWMGSIYRRATSLGVELSPEIRGVMDRLYAGEEATNRAEAEGARPLFSSPEDAEWSDAEYRNYAEAKGIAVDKARAQVAEELNQAAEREHAQDFREEKGNVRDAVTQEIDARPDYTAIRSLRRGSLDDGTELTLNRDALVRQFGEKRVQALQQLHRGLYRNEGGTDAETAAELFGYGSGEEMMRALESAPRRSQAIEGATRDYLVKKYGDVRYDGTLNDRARFAIENDERAGNIYRELKTLRARLASVEKKAADAKAAMAAITTLPLERYQEAARQMIDAKAIADLQPYRYLEASRRFSRDAFDALRKGNAQKAADAKNKELLNHFLFREATAARDYADKFVAYAKRVQSRGIQQRLGLADQNALRAGRAGDFRNQFNWLLFRFGLGPETTHPERTLRDWADDVYGQGNEPAIAPHLFDESRKDDFRSIPLAQVRDLHDALINMRHLAQQEFKMFVQGKQVEFTEARAVMVNSLRENLRSKPVPVLKEDTSGSRLRGWLQNVAVQSTRMEFLMHEFDGGAQGPWHDNLWDRYENAKGDEFAMQHAFTKAVNDHVEALSKEQGLKLLDRVSVEGIPETEPVTRKKLIAFALNMGNEGNLDRLRKSFQWHGWDPEAVDRVRGMLTREEWGFVQKIWDSLKPYGERMNELEKRLTGLPPVMVKVTPFRAPLQDGTEMELPGGYYPIKIDPNYSLKGYNEDAAKTAQNLMERGYGRATTSRGYTKERTGFGGPLLFDYERVLTDHIAKVTKDISHREFMLAANRLLTDPEVRQALRETVGPQYEEQMMPWLRATVNDRNGSLDGGKYDFRNMMEALRSNLVKASLGYKASTALLQLTHLPRIMLFTKPGSYTSAMVDFWKSPVETTEAIRELSPNEMRYRGETLDRDYRAALEQVAKKEGVSASVARLGYSAFKYVDHIVSFPLWKSVYNDALLKGLDSPAAVHEADAAVRMGLGTGTTGDLPPVMRSADLWSKWETTLYGFHNLNWNILRRKVVGDFARAAYKGELDAGSFAKLGTGFAMAWIIPAIISSVVQGDGPKDGENPGLWAAKRSLFFAGGTLPLLKDGVSLVDHGSLNPMVSFAERSVKTGVNVVERKGDAGSLGIDAFQIAGDMAGMPGTNQLAQSLRYIHRAGQGKEKNPNVWNAVVGGR